MLVLLCLELKEQQQYENAENHNVKDSGEGNRIGF